MLKKYSKGSNVIDLVSEETNEDETAYKAILRVVDTDAWSPLIKKILLAGDADEDWMASVRKEYYISDTGVPTYCWVLILWGDLSVAIDAVGVLLVTTKLSPRTPPAPRESEQRPPAATSAVRRQSYQTEDGIRTVSKIPLPFRRGRRDDPGVTKTLGKRKGVGAYVSNVTSAGGL